MSKYLAPIHFWLFDKIKLYEAMEEDIRAKLINDENKALIDKIHANFEPLIGSTQLEEVIDQGNIHGWLQSKISNAEKRQAFLITNLMSSDKEAVLKESLETYYNFGKSSGEKVYSEGTVSSTQDIYNQLNNFLLEGMPCDRVNSVSDASDEHIRWVTQKCLHKDYWDEAGGDIHVYYQMRKSFINGFLAGLGTDFKYEYEDANIPGLLFVHKIYK